MSSDPEVMRYFLKSLNEDESRYFYDKIQEEFSRCGYGFYVIERKEDGAFIGYVGFHHITFDVDFASGVEIMWRLKHQHWNNGYATEALDACLLYAKENIPLQTIWSFATLPNKATERGYAKNRNEKNNGVSTLRY